MKRIGILLLLTLCCSCNHHLCKGVVVDKIHKESFVWVNPMWVTAKPHYLVPMVFPEQYKLIVEDAGVTEVIMVDSDDFKTCEVGDSIAITDNQIHKIK